ncbi:hypothetical protein NLI96_g686 [Meripilus lineatus]|uniref:Uncharacterized protein n=1 Tax=Meripilus lineatus TaxID=2056292 RepID=A0AAD5YI86_9APHY|nr:hypothetical protein NLI96_g686 [Physisporinus lineatus]
MVNQKASLSSRQLRENMSGVAGTWDSLTTPLQAGGSRNPKLKDGAGYKIWVQGTEGHERRGDRHNSPDLLFSRDLQQLRRERKGSVK